MISFVRLSKGMMAAVANRHANEALKAKIIRMFHDTPESGHFGILKTTEIVLRDFYWPQMKPSVRKYVLACG